MSSIINTNVMSLDAQRNLSSTQDALSTAMQRLSSGMRINSAKDDAAGLGISQRMTAQINGLDQAARKDAYQKAAAILAKDLPYYIISDQGYQLFYKKPFPVDVDVTPRGNFRGLIGMPKQ